ncbi:MAG TPA: response regulator [Caulobacteraceae bacterium]|nr:response regulator [Caulobacteraceae bacterium]
MIATDPVKVLLVDDQPAKLLSYEAVLGDLGETLIKASSGREALAQLLRHDIAVVLIDVQLPDLDGFELANMIREHPRYQQTPLIFVSAIHLSDMDRLKGYEVGAVDYVPVPVVPEVLRAKVRVFADLHRKTRLLERVNADLELRVAERTAALEESRGELQALNRQLEIRIEERTHQREQAIAKLFEAQKIDTIGQLTGGVAHDFNNLLMAILGSLELLAKRLPDDPRAARLLENAVQGAQRGAALTQRLLAFARRQELRPEAVDVAQLVGNMEDLIARSIGPSVRIVQAIPRGLPPVLVDANQLEMAVLNLVVNARDAMPGGGTITISARVVEPESDAAAAPADGGQSEPAQSDVSFVSVSVADTGQGMDEATLARAAEPFFTTKGAGKGTGLGLSMVHGLAAQSGGSLRIDSRPGEGTRVGLLLPATAPADAAPRQHEEPVPIASPGAAAMILLVDDDVLVSFGAAAMIEDLGHSVIEANSPEHALEIIVANPAIDLVITDYAMPGMTGIELARRARMVRSDLRFVLASGYADITGAESVSVELPRLAKPFRQHELAAVILAHGPPPAKEAAA